jgi:alkanesulfonate monooxygenase SsuD/methylene tetrahydromethanopterin reductase-like flavin-dependent oxidoreductase (luciferase family)
MKLVGRMGTYLQGYGDLLVRTNGWDPAVLERFLADPVVSSVRGLDVVGTPEQLEHVATLIPAEWLASAATGIPKQCVAAIRHQFDLGCDGVIMHGATPAELADCDRVRRHDGEPSVDHSALSHRQLDL